MKFLLATHNKKKRAELARILAPLGVEVLTAEEAGVALTDVEETGETFEENAVLKAESGCRESGMPCVADDSGLSVDALDGAPGVYSARYAGEHGNDDKNIEKLLDALQDVPQEKRTARFVCTACCIFPDGTRILTSGECPGTIAFAGSGSGGFGYDPVFVPAEADGRSMAELSDMEKDAISHRRRALEKLAAVLSERKM
ncbi:MAG: RdgB/HAM1 family non-canonical purine NTP pyrophosphatase [Oscillospiraceae bacterium]|nr:RdgB/HAM1 family non-canonical purine NTP pyrophosphatase [Oscillospiraceae bacterium]